jgi:two-component system, NtrC family, nitrogen regulation sensor histidine kinase NtrY
MCWWWRRWWRRAWRVMVADRRSKSSGSRLHLRLSGVFALCGAGAHGPGRGVCRADGERRAGGVVFRPGAQRGRRLAAAAEAYEAEQRRDLTEDAEALAAYLGLAKQARGSCRRPACAQLLTEGQAQVQRGLREAYLIDGAGTIRAGRAVLSVRFRTAPPEELARAPPARRW